MTPPTPATPAPDTKDWTWVLDAPCPQCRFVAGEVPVEGAAALVRAQLPVWSAALADAEVARTRPAPDVWSPLEYGCHVRDVCRVFAGRLRLMLTQVDPVFDTWDQDATALAERYDLADPATVGTELREAAEAMADALDAVPAGALDRPGRRSNGSVFTVASLTRYFLHDLVHHAWDVRGVVGRT